MNGVLLEPRQVVDYAVLAEEHGWDGVFVSDAISDGWSDPWTVLGAVAARTERIAIGTWITPVPQQAPWRLAHSLASLDRLAEGRLILGAGLGAPSEYEMFGGSYDPKALGRRYDEALQIMVGLWSGEPFSFEGEFYTVRDAKLPVTPVQEPRIPIVLGCWWPHRKPFRRAAEWDGIMPFWPALLKEGAGPQGETASGSREEELREMLGYYRSVADDPGEIVLPMGKPDPDYQELCEELGATWLLHGSIRDEDGLRQGPPR